MIAISLRPSGRKWGTVSFASTLHLVPVLDLLLAEVPPAWQDEVRLGLQEALVNASKHGNNLDPSKTVLVKFSLTGGEYSWTIADQGEGFKPVSKCDCQIDGSQPLSELGECGRGLYILYQIFDQVCWNQQGNELKLCKQIGSRHRFSPMSS